VDWTNLTGAKKVHSLIDKVYKRKNLAMAWEKVKANRGSGGVDGQTLEAFEEQLDQQLDRLQRELRMCQVFCVNDLDFVLGFVVALGFAVVVG
jgi:retron-type reverse transcriptase